MKYQLSFCEINQLFENVFETIPIEGSVINRNCVDECWSFWNKLRKKPFGLLVNCKNEFSFSPEGSLLIWKNPLQRKTAILLNNAEQGNEIKNAIESKKIAGNYIYHQFFTDKKEAIKWLSDI